MNGRVSRGEVETKRNPDTGGKSDVGTSTGIFIVSASLADALCEDAHPPQSPPLRYGEWGYNDSSSLPDATLRVGASGAVKACGGGRTLLEAAGRPLKGEDGRTLCGAAGHPLKEDGRTLRDATGHPLKEDGRTLRDATGHPLKEDGRTLQGDAGRTVKGGAALIASRLSEGERLSSQNAALREGGWEDVAG